MARFLFGLLVLAGLVGSGVAAVIGWQAGCPWAILTPVVTLIVLAVLSSFVKGWNPEDEWRTIGEITFPRRQRPGSPGAFFRWFE